MLKVVFERAMHWFWDELRSVETQLRNDLGLAMAEPSEPSIEEEFRRFLDEYVEAERALFTLGFRLARGGTLSQEKAPVLKTPQRRVKVRHPSRVAKLPEGFPAFDVPKDARPFDVTDD